MSNTQVIQSMFKHLTQSYSADEAREILIQKYPDAEGEINTLEVSAEPAEVIEQTATSKLATAVKQKTAKPKVVKPAKAKKVTKMDQARQLYADATDKSRAAMIDVFGKKLGLSKAAASTYFYTIKK